ncbi:hypothetical protein DC522_26735 [Microvirga sp. KLBC 81]|uniref:hypothetical protein n=1 Tax=Microvirga sp. KLBC 81 TaxID=1862707 RepID=UPI000D5138BF|nr:hypothetical protein [Microvirga sp. KLBC 81]PVE21422.1 hypothetical protein DC522_26735 [Microvirga sp. KLBC 81]
MKIIDLPVREVRFGFSGPDDRVVSLNIPAANEDGRPHPFCSFDIEYDPEQPDMLTICLLEEDQDSFIRTVRESIPFPVRRLAELLSRREATAEEVAAWRSVADEDE